MGETTGHRGGHKQIPNPGTSQIVNEVAFPFYTIYEQKTFYVFPRLSFRFTILQLYITARNFRSLYHKCPYIVALRSLSASLS